MYGGFLLVRTTLAEGFGAVSAITGRLTRAG